MTTASNSLSRRQFIAAAAAVAGASALPVYAATKSATPPVCVFSKHLQFLDYPALAKTCKDLGLDGVDLTVRKGGHVLPEKVAEDLPRAVEAIRAEGLCVPMITTNLLSGKEPEARSTLQAASKLGIRYFRCGPYRYAKTGDPAEQLPKLTEELKGLAKLAKDCDMIGGYHNHSGFGYVGAPLWDLHTMVRGTGLDSIGSNFDVGHATVEGGYGAWRTNALLMASCVKMMAVKDFVWTDGDRPQWVTLGEGRVKTAEFLKIFREVGFAGPISIHFEYKTPSRDVLLEEIRESVVTVRAALKEAGYA